MTPQERLWGALRLASIPCTGFSVQRMPPADGDVRIDFLPEATPTQRAAAASILATFDWSAEADAAAEAAQIRTDAGTLLTTGNGASGAVLRAVVAVVLDEINTLRTRAGLTARTAQQLADAIRAKL